MANARALLCAALALTCACQASAYTKPDQQQIITAFRDAMFARPGNSWERALASWTCPTDPGNSDSTCDPCGRQVWGNWEHLGCRGERLTFEKYRVPGDGTVTNVHITDYGVEGTVPLAELCALKGLREFDLDGGALTGTIPTGFAQCYPELTELDLSYNKLSGTVPKEIAQVETLEQFKVEHNQLTGTIPAEYGNMASMGWLRFADNKMNGKIPESFAGIARRLNQLTLDVNDFEGNLYMLSNHHFVNFNADSNPKMCGMVPVGVRFAHSFNFYKTGLGMPCPEELAGGWADLSEQL